MEEVIFLAQGKQVLWAQEKTASLLLAQHIEQRSSSELELATSKNDDFKKNNKKTKLGIDKNLLQ